MNVLIVGAGGFIGYHLTHYFIQKGFKITTCDIKKINFSHAENILIHPFNPDFHEQFKNKEFDFCINASGSASVPYSIENPAEDFRLNVSNVNLLLHAILNANPTCRFINFSSAAVYGNPISMPISEDMPLSPLSPYGFHKMISEQICTEFWNLYNIHTCSLRVFSAFGPGLQKQLFWDLFQKMKTGKKLELFGNGNESRDFIYIEDLVHAVHCIMENAIMEGEAINVATGSEVFIKDVVKEFTDSMQWQKGYSFTGSVKKGDPINWCADNNKLIGMGFESKTSLKNGIKKIASWMKTL